MKSCIRAEQPTASRGEMQNDRIAFPSGEGRGLNPTRFDESNRKNFFEAEIKYKYDLIVLFRLAFPPALSIFPEALENWQAVGTRLSLKLS